MVHRRRPFPPEPRCALISKTSASGRFSQARVGRQSGRPLLPRPLKVADDGGSRFLSHRLGVRVSIDKATNVCFWAQGKRNWTSRLTNLLASVGR